MFKSKTKKAFTIVELVIVIAVIAILMGIMFVGGTAISNNAKASTLDSDFRTFETNLKAMVNDPTAHCIKTVSNTDPFDPNDTDPKALMNSFFEGDLEFTTFPTALANDDHAALREAYEGELKMKDPYGVPYRAIVMDNSTAEHTDITFLVYSCGKNKQTSETANDGKFDKDDVATIVRIVDSVVYTGTISPLGADTAYMTAVKVAAKSIID